MCKCSAIHFNVTLVSARTRRAIPEIKQAEL